MNRNFENRKPTKVYAKSKENQMIIKALNMYGRVPETWELLKEIERLNNKEERLMRRLEDLIIVGKQVENEWAVDICKMIIKELKGSDKEWEQEQK